MSGGWPEKKKRWRRAPLFNNKRLLSQLGLFQLFYFVRIIGLRIPPHPFPIPFIKNRAHGRNVLKPALGVKRPGVSTRSLHVHFPTDNQHVCRRVPVSPYSDCVLDVTTLDSFAVIDFGSDKSWFTANVVPASPGENGMLDSLLKFEQFGPGAGQPVHVRHLQHGK